MRLVTPIDRRALPDNTVEVYRRVGLRIAKWRYDNKVSQVEFARRAEVSVGCLQGLESGTRATRDENLKKIGAVLGLTLEELKQEDDAVIPTDPRLQNLTDEDLSIAQAFHDARTATRLRVQRLLEGGVDKPLQLAERIGKLDASFQQTIEDLISDAEQTLAPNQRTAERPAKK